MNIQPMDPTTPRANRKALMAPPPTPPPTSLVKWPHDFEVVKYRAANYRQSPPPTPRCATRVKTEALSSPPALRVKSEAPERQQTPQTPRKRDIPIIPPTPSSRPRYSTSSHSPRHPVRSRTSATPTSLDAFRARLTRTPTPRRPRNRASTTPTASGRSVSCLSIDPPPSRGGNDTSGSGVSGGSGRRGGTSGASTASRPSRASRNTSSVTPTPTPMMGRSAYKHRPRSQLPIPEGDVVTIDDSPSPSPSPPPSPTLSTRAGSRALTAKIDGEGDTQRDRPSRRPSTFSERTYITYRGSGSELPWERPRSVSPLQRVRRRKDADTDASRESQMQLAQALGPPVPTGLLEPCTRLMGLLKEVVSSTAGNGSTGSALATSKSTETPTFRALVALSAVRVGSELSNSNSMSERERNEATSPGATRAADDARIATCIRAIVDTLLGVESDDSDAKSRVRTELLADLDEDDCETPGNQAQNAGRHGEGDGDGHGTNKEVTTVKHKKDRQRISLFLGHLTTALRYTLAGAANGFAGPSSRLKTRAARQAEWYAYLRAALAFPGQEVRAEMGAAEGERVVVSLRVVWTRLERDVLETLQAQGVALKRDSLREVVEIMGDLAKVIKNELFAMA